MIEPEFAALLAFLWVWVPAWALTANPNSGSDMAECGVAGKDETQALLTTPLVLHATLTIQVLQPRA